MRQQNACLFLPPRPPEISLGPLPASLGLRLRWAKLSGCRPPLLTQQLQAPIASELHGRIALWLFFLLLLLFLLVSTKL